MKKIFVFSIVIFSLLCLLFCQTKAFKNIQVKGRLIHFYTGEPVKDVLVQLRADDVTMHGTGTTSGASMTVMGSSHSSEDGYFDINSKASKRNNYYLSIYDNDVNGIHKQLPLKNEFSVSEKETNDVGTFLTGTKTFYCKIIFHISSSSGISIQLSGASLLPPGSNGEFLDARTFDNSSYTNSSGKYVLEYDVIKAGVTTHSTTSIPLQPDTMSISMNY